MSEFEQGWKGYELRDYASNPEFCAAPEFSGKLYPRKDWIELIELQRKNLSSPKHVHDMNSVKPMSQKSTNFCWMYGTVACVLNRYAAQGIDPSPKLNAFATAALGKKGRNRGGYGIEAVRYIEKWGICTTDVWREFDWNLKNYNKEEVKASAARHRIVEFEEFSREGIWDSVVSALLCPINPCPVTLAYSHWRHLVAGMQVTYRGSKSRPEFGITFMNSWGNWGSKKDGYGTFYGQKAVPFESIAVRSTKVRSE